MNTPVMRPSAVLSKVFLYWEPIDFRKSFRGLAVLVEQELGHNPFDGYLVSVRKPMNNPTQQALTKFF